MIDKPNKWDTHTVSPYYSEVINPYAAYNRSYGAAISNIQKETFALTLWILQEKYHFDLELSYILAQEWRYMDQRLLARIFGKTEEEIWAEIHTQKDYDDVMVEIMSNLPKRNKTRIPRPYGDLECVEGEYE